MSEVAQLENNVFLLVLFSLHSLSTKKVSCVAAAGTFMSCLPSFQHAWLVSIEDTSKIRFFFVSPEFYT